MSLNFEEVNVLGNIINDTYGKASTNQGELGRGYSPGGTGVPSSVATKASLHGDKLTITSLAIINLGPISSQHHEISKIENELNQHINKYVSNTKKEFKKKENAGRALKCKQIKDSERTDVEMINHYAATRRAYVRRCISYEVS
tara:strand:- start:541 stop:972 length:432 start_codon:yes stop_codon:yes gene_type:complete